MKSHRLELFALPDIPLIQPGDDLATIIVEAVDRNSFTLEDNDIVILAQKIVSKSQGRYVDLNSVVPTAKAEHLAQEVQKDPRLVQVILDESDEVIRYRPGVLIVSHRCGVIMANAGIDRSNIEQGDREQVLLLPADSDASAQAIRDNLYLKNACKVGVIICDSVGRAWRNGTTGIAIGAAGVDAYSDLRGQNDLFGNPLRVSSVGVADQIAGAAELLMGEAAEGLPVVILRGMPKPVNPSNARALLRDPQFDLFR